MNIEKIERRLWELGQRGYVFRIPGGSSKNGHLSSLGYIYREAQMEPEILLVPYNPRIKIERKYGEEPEERRFYETKEGALSLKLAEQTGIIIKNWELVTALNVPNSRKEVNAVDHTKYLFVITVFDDSNIRKESSPDTRLGPPLWVPLSIAKNNICHQHYWTISPFEDWYKYHSAHIIN